MLNRSDRKTNTSSEAQLGSAIFTIIVFASCVGKLSNVCRPQVGPIYDAWLENIRLVSAFAE